MTGTKKIAMFGSAAALAFAVGFGGVGVSSLGNTPNDDSPCASRCGSTRQCGSRRPLRHPHRLRCRPRLLNPSP